MKLTLSSIYWKDKILFPKYPEPWKDFSHWDKFDFYAGDYAPSVIHTEEARILPVIWNKIKVLVWEGALDKSMIDYYNHTYPETFSDKKIISYKYKEYYNLIENIKRKSLITLHPYSWINEKLYYIDPNITFFLNNKENISKLTENTPKRETLLLEEIRKIDKFPVVLKSFTWASWDWVRIINDKKKLLDALDYFKSEEKLIVEEYIYAVDNIWIQLFISEKGEVKILGVSRQIVTDEWEYEWSIFNRNDNIDPNLEKIALDVWINASKIWFNWICWLDFLKDELGQYFLIDPNFRLTWATSGIFLKERIFKERDHNIIQVQQFKSNHSDIKIMINENLNLWKDGLYLLSSYKDNVSSIISWFSIVTWESAEHIEHKKRNLYKKKWFIL